MEITKTKNYHSPECCMLDLQPEGCIAASFDNGQSEGLTGGWNEEWNE